VFAVAPTALWVLCIICDMTPFLTARHTHPASPLTFSTPGMLLPRQW
jgi:hypothetical protein